jgi:hypothetical protein
MKMLGMMTTVLLSYSTLALGQESLLDDFVGCYQTVKVDSRDIAENDRVTTRWYMGGNRRFCETSTTPCRIFWMDMEDRNGTILGDFAPITNQSVEQYNGNGIKITYDGATYNAAGELEWASLGQTTTIEPQSNGRIAVVYLAEMGGNTVFGKAEFLPAACPTTGH